MLLNVILLPHGTEALNLDDAPSKIDIFYFIKAVLMSCVFGVLWELIFRLARK